MLNFCLPTRSEEATTYHSMYNCGRLKSSFLCDRGKSLNDLRGPDHQDARTRREIEFLRTSDRTCSLVPTLSI